VVGLLTWPFTGDPDASLGLIAHPGPIADMDITHDGRKMLTAGAQDGVINVWEVHA
jgi:hypothetical protein